MKRQSLERYLNNLTAHDGNIEMLTNIRPEDPEKLYLCDKHANVSADILTAFHSPIDIDIEIIFTQNVIDLRPTNEYCRFVQSIPADTRNMPICGPIILCANGFTAIYIKSKNKTLINLKCYGLSLNNNDQVRILKRHTIITTTLSPNVFLEYKKGFVAAYGDDDADDRSRQTERFFIIPDPCYDP